MLTGLPVVTISRGHRVESVHHIAACAADATGTTRMALGSVEEPVFLRSAWKPFFTAAVLREIARDDAFSDAEIAVMCASHAAQPRHLEAVASILQKAGADVSDLRCGLEPTAVPGLDDAERALRNECSGNHAAMLALCRSINAPIHGYLDLAHPVQECIRQFCERVTEDDFAPDQIATDGCGAPVYATSLRKASSAYARLATASGATQRDRTALKRVRQAMATCPDEIRGAATFDSEFVRAFGGEAVSKFGSDGVQAVGLLQRGLGVVVKVLDGSERAGPPAMLAILDELKALDPSRRYDLIAFRSPDVRAVSGMVVGHVDASI